MTDSMTRLWNRLNGPRPAEPAAAPEAPVEPRPTTVVVPPPPPRVPARPMAMPSLDELERLVAAAELRHPDEAAGWRWTLFYLRPFSNAAGELPSDFRPLVQSEFGSLLGLSRA
jgi:hypothetical protein